MRTFSDSFRLLAAKAATGVDKFFMCSDYRHVILQFATASSADMTVKIQISDADTAPDFSAAASQTNPWIYADVVDLATNSVIAGATGLVWAGSDAVRIVEVNTNGIKWVSVVVTAYAAGNINADAKG